MVITGVHPLIYSDDAPATRAFFRDVLRWAYVDWEVEPGWLMFAGGPSEFGVHPTRSEWEGQVYDSPRHHEISLMCDDLDATMAELAARGATFAGEPRDEVYGRIVMLHVPGADDIQLYQPSYPTALDAG